MDSRNLISYANQASLPPIIGSIGSNYLDVAARGFWQDGEMAFFDIRVFNPFARTHLNTNIEQAFKSNESQKKKSYNERVVRIEHGSFTPIVLSAMGGFGRETAKFTTRLIEKISEKKDLMNSVVANFVRTKISFELVKAQVMCIRGSRTLRNVEMDPSLAEWLTILLMNNIVSTVLSNID